MPGFELIGKEEEEQLMIYLMMEVYYLHMDLMH